MKSKNEKKNIAIKDRPGDADWIIDEIVNNIDKSEQSCLLCISFGKASIALDAWEKEFEMKTIHIPMFTLISK